jgi:hypothetical protein
MEKEFCLLVKELHKTVPVVLKYFEPVKSEILLAFVQFLVSHSQSLLPWLPRGPGVFKLH